MEIDEIRARELASQYYDAHPELHIYDLNLDMEYSESDGAWGADLSIGPEEDPDIEGFLMVRDDGTVYTYGLDTPPR